MKTKIFAFLVCLVSIVGCSPSDAGKGLEHFLTQKTERVDIQGIRDIKFDIISDTLKNQNAKICYILNATCSFCFAKFFKFENELENFGINGQLAVILDQGTACYLEFYQEKMEVKRKINIIENIDSEFIDGNIENGDLNGFFFICENGSIDCYQYLEL